MERRERELGSREERWREVKRQRPEEEERA